MVAIVGGFGAALSWAVATLASTRSSRMIGAWSVIAWVMTIGFLVSLGPALLTQPSTVDAAQIAGLLVIGISYNAGLLLTYAALTIGRISIVAPIVAAEGAAAALISVALGESINVPSAIVLAAIAVGVVLSSIERAADPDAAGPGDAAGRRDPAKARRAIILAVAASATFSIGLVLAGRLGTVLPVAWIIVSSRVIGVVGVAVPMLLLGRLRLVPAAIPFLVVSGVLEATGSGLYILAAHDGVAAAAVLSSQFAAIAAVAAFVLFGERLARIQIAGVAVIALGVTALAVVRA